MRDKDKTKTQLLNELAEIRRRIAELERMETERKQGEVVFQHRGKFERLITTLSTEFINVEADELDAAINRTLKQIGELTGTDRSYVFLFSSDKTKVDMTHEWRAEGIEPQIDKLKGLPVETIPWWMAKLNRFKNIHIPRVADLPPEASSEKEILQSHDTRSLIVIPLLYGKSLIGFLGFDSVRTEKAWSEESIDILKIVGDVFANALEHKWADEALRESEKRYQDLYDQAPDMYFSVKPNGEVASVNRFGAEYLGYCKEELIGKPVWNIVHKDDLRRVQEQVSNIFSQKLLKSELVFRKARKDGSIIWVQERVQLIFNEDGAPEELRIICRDVTEHKEWEERIAYLSQAVERMGEMVIVTDLNHVVTYANPAVEDILGYQPEEIVGQDSREFFKGVPGNPPDLVQWIKDQETTGIWRGELFNRRRDGTIIKIHLTLSPMKDGTGTLLGYVGVSMDITEREHLETELYHARKMETIGTLAGGLAHDFNNILAGIMGFASLARKGLPKGNPFIADMETIENLSQRGTGITRALLTLARRGEFHPQSMSFNRIIEDVLKVIHISAGKNIQIRTALSPTLSNIIGDKGQLYQVIMNLYLNACEAMPEGGVLSVRTSDAELDRRFFLAHPALKKRDYVLVIISDTGIGMDSATRVRIFDPFFTTKTEQSGTGLGLSMVSGIIEGHEGHIEVESEPGKGSVFTIYLPATEEEISEEPPRSIEELKGDETLLFVDDEDSFRESIGRRLRELGYTVIEAESGEDALKALDGKKDRIDLAILDVIMKGMGGAETFEKMRNIVADLPVIICSGYSLDDSSTQLIPEGAEGFIQKPCAPEELANKIREVLEKKQKRFSPAS